MSTDVEVLETPGYWRVVADEHHHGRPLPSAKGQLLVLRIPFGRMKDRWLVMFETATTSGQRIATSARFDGCRLILDEGSVAYMPASLVARGPKLPVPPRPKLKSFQVTRPGELPVAHHVATVHKWPNPNRDWNRNDALVTADCGYRRWIAPNNMTLSPSADICPNCFWGSGGGNPQ